MAQSHLQLPTLPSLADNFGPVTAEESHLLEKLDLTRLPRHIAVIMDGNGRWAKKRHLPRIAGHSAGTQSARTTIETCARLHIEALTLYAFSVENWRRPKAEIEFLMQLLREYIRKEMPLIQRNNIRMRFLGRPDELPDAVRRDSQEATAATANNTGMVLSIALNYGGRAELVDAMNAILTARQQGSSTNQSPQMASSERSNALASGLLGVKAHIANETSDFNENNFLRENARARYGPITEEEIARHLYTAELPDPDLLIRTSGEMRVSNFLLWQIAYAEIFVTETLWPDFSRARFLESLIDFQKRERRYGAIEPTSAAR